MTRFLVYAFCVTCALAVPSALLYGIRLGERQVHRHVDARAYGLLQDSVACEELLRSCEAGCQP